MDEEKEQVQQGLGNESEKNRDQRPLEGNELTHLRKNKGDQVHGEKGQW